MPEIFAEIGRYGSGRGDGGYPEEEYRPLSRSLIFPIWRGARQKRMHPYRLLSGIIAGNMIRTPRHFFGPSTTLQDRDIPFQLIVVGQSFRDEPVCFQEARLRLSKQILHFGYVESRKEYIRLLKRGNVVVSTALQEFFGISVLEAVRAGCRPLLPNRLSYPELFPRKYLYSEGEFAEQLAAVLLERPQVDQNEYIEITNRFQWENCREQYEEWLFSSDS